MQPPDNLNRIPTLVPSPSRVPSALSVTSSNKSLLSSVAEVLFKLQLSHHADNFLIHCITRCSDLQMLTQDQMKEMGMWKVGERNRLVRWIQQSAAQRHLSRSDSMQSRLQHRQPPIDVVKTIRRLRGKSNKKAITVSGSGIEEINGVYQQAGQWDGVPRYTKGGLWKGERVEFQLFQCRLLNDTKRWFFSIVPKDQNPGTNLDIDFYASPIVQDLADVPPQGGWNLCQHGVEPPPTLDCEFDFSCDGNETYSEVESTNAVVASLSTTSESRSGPETTYVPLKGGSNQAIGLPPPPVELRMMMNHKLLIENAGASIVNGVYSPTGSYEGAMIYKKGVYVEGKRTILSLFRCLVKGNQQRWYISIVPQGAIPGTSLDTDFYSAPAAVERPELPPRRGWVEAEEGVIPPPRLAFLSLDHTSGQYQLSLVSSESCGEHQIEKQTSSSFATDQAVRVGRKTIHVHGASLSIINGLYNPSGTCDKVPKYTKQVLYKGRRSKISLFRCRVKGNKKRWYLSIAPDNETPGTINDIDFYTAPAGNPEDVVPPKDGWVTVGEGVGHAPTVEVARSSDLIETPSLDNANDEETQESKDDEETRSSDTHEEGQRVQQVTPRASGSRKMAQWNPLGKFINMQAKELLSKSGINPESIEFPHVVTFNGKTFQQRE